MTERLLSVGGVDLCVETFGSPSDPTILLIHGACASVLWWPRAFCVALAALAARWRHVVRYDSRDTGRSMGSGVAMVAALDHPERVATLTLVGTTTGADDVPPMSPAFLSRPTADDPVDDVVLLMRAARPGPAARRQASLGPGGHVPDGPGGQGGRPVRRVSPHAPAARPLGRDRAAGTCTNYRYWPVLLAVSIARPDSAFLPVTRVRM
jgi:pimeloyl-ACP methyl ester carboxylesterase